MSVAFYDSALVSMISRVIEDEELLLFPKSFTLPLENQLPEGGW